MPYPRATPFVGVIEDLKNRLPIYASDFDHICSMKVFASILFMFFTSIGPAITFASLLVKDTDNNIGVVEVMMSTAIGGMVWAVFAGQPLVIVGVTGPVSLLTASIYTMSKNWGINFLPFYAWSQIWAAIMHAILAFTNFSDALPWITRFSCEIFGVLIAVIYLQVGIVDISLAFTDNGASFESGMWQFVVSVGMCWLALQLFNARNWIVFTSKIRDVIADYGASVSLMLWTAVVYFPNAKDVPISKLEVPDKFSTSTGRSWLIDLYDLPTWAIFAALLPGAIITVLFIFDHNVSSLMAQDKEFKLKKPSAFHWDIVVLGICLAITGVMGLPPVNGLIPQAPLHTKSLLITRMVATNAVDTDHSVDPLLLASNGEAKRAAPGASAANSPSPEMPSPPPTPFQADTLLLHRKPTSAAAKGGKGSKKKDNDDEEDEEIAAASVATRAKATGGARVLVVDGCLEQRQSNFLQSALCGLMCFQPFLGIIALVPTAALSGLFLFMGMTSFIGNHFAERMLLMVTQRKLRTSEHSFFTLCRHREIRQFTVIQIVITIIIFGITLTPAKMVFPVLIGVLVPLRLVVLPKYFKKGSLDALDPPIVEETENDIVRHMQQEAAIDEGDLEEDEDDAAAAVVVAAGSAKGSVTALGAATGAASAATAGVELTVRK